MAFYKMDAELMIRVPLSTRACINLSVIFEVLGKYTVKLEKIY